MRAKHGLRADGAVILVSAGGFGVGRIDDADRPRSCGSGTRRRSSRSAAGTRS